MKNVNGNVFAVQVKGRLNTNDASKNPMGADCKLSHRKGFCTRVNLAILSE